MRQRREEEGKRREQKDTFERSDSVEASAFSSLDRKSAIFFYNEKMSKIEYYKPRK